MALFKFEQELRSLQITKEKLDKLALDPLTDKEFDVVMEMIKGQSYSDLETKLNISKNTLKYHTKRIFNKFDVSNRANLMQMLLSHFASI